MSTKPCPACPGGRGPWWWFHLCDEHRRQADEYSRRARTRTCMYCGTTFEGRTRTWQKTGLCSESCRLAWEAKKARDRRKHLAPAHELTCGACGEPFTGQRSDAQYCTTRCRVAAHRRRLR